MRLLLACLLLVGFGCGDDDSPGSGDGGAATSGGAGSSGKSGSSAAGSGAGGKGASGMTGSGGKSGSGPGQSGTGGKSGAGGGGGGSGPKLGMIKLVPNVIAGKQTGGGAGGVGSQQNALRVGSPSATTLLSLKYYITSIQLCEDLEVMGSGFSSTKGCISLYQNMPAGSPDYNEYSTEEAKDDNTPGRYIDLMSADGQAALRKPVMLQVPIATEPAAPVPVEDSDGGVAEAPKQQAGVYRYGLINFYRPIKVKAEFPIIGEPSTNYFRTKAVAAIHETPGMNGGPGSDRIDIGNTLSGDTEETTYMLNNGGVLFVFQKPFAITQADVDAKAEINIDLVFNPENFGQAYVTQSCAADMRVVICDPVNNVSMDMPYVRMSPVPRKTGEKTHKETYLVDYDLSSKVRIELYYNDADSEASVQGVDTTIVYTSAPTSDAPSFNTIASNFVSQSGSVTTANASVSLKDYQFSTNLEGLVRRKDGTLTIHCLFPGSICSTLNETFTRAYTYVGDTVVSGN
jgi:hypothetical protein